MSLETMFFLKDISAQKVIVLNPPDLMPTRPSFSPEADVTFGSFFFGNPILEKTLCVPAPPRPPTVTPPRSPSLLVALSVLRVTFGEYPLVALVSLLAFVWSGVISARRFNFAGLKTPFGLKQLYMGA